MGKDLIRRLEFLSALLIGILPIGLIIGTFISNLIIFIIDFFFLLIFFKKKKFDILKQQEFFFFILIWFYLLINFILAENSQLAFERSFFFIRYIVLVYALANIFNYKNYQKIIFFIWSFIIIVLTADIFFEFIFNKNILGYSAPDHTRIVSFMKTEMRIGGLVLMFGLFVISFWIKFYIKKNTNFFFKILIFFISFAIFCGIFLTGERAVSIKALLCSTLLIFFVNYKKKFLLFVLVFLLPISLFYMSENINQRYKSLYIDLTQKDKFYQTLHGAHYSTAISIFKEYPVLGVGVKNFREECKKDKYDNNKYLKIKERCSTHPHQIYFEILSEMGLVGFILIFSFLLIIFFKALIIFFKKRDLILLSSILYLFSSLIPLLPSGSFFSSFNATLFWINFSIILQFILNKNKK